MIGPLFMNDFLKYYFKNNFLTSKKINAISELYELSFDKLLSLYNDRFINLFKYAYKYSSFYKNISICDLIKMKGIYHAV